MILMTGLVIAAVAALGATTIVLVVVMLRRSKLRRPARRAEPAVVAAVPEMPRSLHAREHASLKRRLPGVAATDAYAVVPQRSSNVWFLVPPKTMDFSDVD